MKTALLRFPPICCFLSTGKDIKPTFEGNLSELARLECTILPAIEIVQQCIAETESSGRTAQRK